MKKSNVYTRTGDHGTSSLVGGIRVSKTDKRLDAYGTVDELNAHLGLLETYVEQEEDRKIIKHIQNKLFSIGTYLATEPNKTEFVSQLDVLQDDVDMLEKQMDIMDNALPKLSAFVLPGGCRAASQAHVCRTVCRRAERCILKLCGEQIVDENVTIFINRLSDYLFVLSRKLNLLTDTSEIFWNKSCK